MTVGKEETIAIFPGGLLGPVAHRVKICDRQHVGNIERLRDIALALNFAHAQGVAANVARTLRKARRVDK